MPGPSGPPTAGDGGSDSARRLVAERNLAAPAFAHLTTDAFMALPFEALAPTKTLLKRFFSTESWTEADDDALAGVVGPGDGRWERPLDNDLTLVFGWEDGRFGVRVMTATAIEHHDGAPPDDLLAGTFDGPVVPEATPNPRTIRFQVGPIHDGPSRWYESASAAAEDFGASRLFAEFPEVANVLVGPDFVAVGLQRPADWERLLRPVLDAVTEDFFTPGTAGAGQDAPRVMGGPAGAGAAVVAPGPSGPIRAGDAGPSGPIRAGDAGPSRPSRSPAGATAPARRLSRLQLAWRELGALRPARADDFTRVREAAAGEDPARRQVAANLLREADADVAAEEWSRLVGDSVRSVRRAAVDAMVDVGREELRPLLEQALSDEDAWVRWKALRGLAELGAGPSRDAVEALSGDPDFRVRFEAAAALRAAG